MRGKHAARSAQRRAASAEDQMDRLLPQLESAKATAKRYRADAERTTALAAQVAELRQTVGVPLAEHEAALAAKETEADEREAIAYRHLDDCIEVFVTLLRPRLDPESCWISARLLGVFRALPADRGMRILRKIGMDREFARLCLSGNTASMVQHRVGRDVLNLKALAASQGLAGIPADWLDERNASRVPEGTGRMPSDRKALDS